MNFYESVIFPLYKILEGKDVKSLFGKGEMFLNLFAELHDKDEKENQIQSLPFEDKNKLWEESKEYCPLNRLAWCKAVRFYKSLKH
jgi:hypothetical protein